MVKAQSSAEAQAARDALLRQAEHDQEVVMHMLRERGYNTRDTIIENELVIDNRPLGSLSPVKSKLEYSQGFIAHRQQFAQQKASRSDYLRMSPSELALAKARAKQPKVVITPKEQLHQRLVVLISDDHFDRTGRARRASRMMNDLGIFPPSINAIRAATQCHAEGLIRPSYSMDQMRAIAEEQLATGYERPPPMMSANGEMIELTGPERLRGKLEKLDERIQREAAKAVAVLLAANKAAVAPTRRDSKERVSHATERAGGSSNPAVAPSWHEEPPAPAKPQAAADAAFPQPGAGGGAAGARPMRVSQSMPALSKSKG